MPKNPFIPEPHPYDHPDLKEHRALLRSAPRLAWKFVRLFVTGDGSRPDRDAPEVQWIAWRIYRRSYTAPPIWLKHEWQQEKLRS